MSFQTEPLVDREASVISEQISALNQLSIGKVTAAPEEPEELGFDIEPDISQLISSYEIHRLQPLVDMPCLLVIPSASSWVGEEVDSTGRASRRRDLGVRLAMQDVWERSRLLPARSLTSRIFGVPRYIDVANIDPKILLTARLVWRLCDAKVLGHLGVDYRPDVQEYMYSAIQLRAIQASLN